MSSFEEAKQTAGQGCSTDASTDGGSFKKNGVAVYNNQTSKEGYMFVSKEIRELLRTKLNFTEQQIHFINDDLAYSAKVLGFVQIIQSEFIGRSEKLSALNSLQEIRAKISATSSSKSLLTKAYDDFYSFKKYKSVA